MLYGLTKSASRKHLDSDLVFKWSLYRGQGDVGKRNHIFDTNFQFNPSSEGLRWSPERTAHGKETQGSKGNRNRRKGNSGPKDSGSIPEVKQLIEKGQFHPPDKAGSVWELLLVKGFHILQNPAGCNYLGPCGDLNLKAFLFCFVLFWFALLLNHRVHKVVFIYKV